MFESVDPLLLTSLVYYVALGITGGVLNCLVAHWEYSQRYEWIRRSFAGGIVGVICFAGRDKIPNHLTTAFLGYFAIDAVELIWNKLGILTKTDEKKP